MRTEKSAGNEKNCTQKRLEHSRNARRQCWNTVEMRTDGYAGKEMLRS